MDKAPVDGGLEFVFDHRKLIVGFLLMILVCGSFFVLGYIEGKRQGLKAAGEALPASPAEPPAAAAASDPAPAEPPPATAAGEAQAAKESKAVREQLDWYENVNNPGESAGLIEKPARGRAEPAAGTPKAPAPAPPAAASRQTYTVQVGAFRMRKDAESLATQLKAKGFPSTIELSPPDTGQQLFLLKVGKFQSRSEAAEMRLRLKKEGLRPFIKANP